MKTLRVKAILSFLTIICFCAFCPAGEPIAHWKLDETSGTTAYDSTGSNDGTLINGPVWTSGKIDGALEFDGSDDYVEIPSPNGLKIPLPITLCAWVKLHSKGTTQQYIIITDDVTDRYRGAVLSVLASGVLGGGYNDGGVQTSSHRRSKQGSTSLDVNQWYHVAIVLRGPTDIRHYINGIEDAGTYSGTGGNIGYSAAGSAYIGTGIATGGRLDGLIDDARVYNYALDPNELQELYEEGSPPPEPKLIAHWKLDETSGTTAYDSAGINDGTLVNGPVWTSGNIDGALEFDGSDDYVEIPSPNDLKIPLPITLSAWVKQYATVSHSQYIIVIDDNHPATYVGLSFGITAGGILSGGYCDGGIETSSHRRTKDGTTVLETNTWYHVVFVIRGPTNMSFYINAVDDGGTYSGTGGSIAYTATGSAYIGTGGDPEHLTGLPGARMNGLIDDVRVYNYALDTNEIAELYEEGLPPPPEPKLVAHWTFDEGSGSTAYDSEDGHDGTITGATWTTEGRIGGALNFDGNNDYVRVPNHSDFDFPAGFTLCAWAKPALGNTDNRIIYRYDPTSQDGYGLTQSPNNGGAYFFGQSVNGVGGPVTSDVHSVAGQWAFVVGVREDNGDTKIYVDGVLQSDIKNISGAIDSSGDLFIGVAYLLDKDFTGLIDDVRIYNYALDPNEIAELYDEGIPDLLSISIAGPNSVPEESNTGYQVIGHYDNGSIADITSDANFTVAPDEFAAIDPNGLLTTYRLYRMQETCTIYAYCQGFAVLKPVTIYPLCDGNQCTQQQLLNRNVADVIQIKEDILADLQYAMKIERASMLMLSNQKPWGHSFKPYPPGQLNRARLHLLAALLLEQWADKQIDRSIDFIELAQQILLEAAAASAAAPQQGGGGKR